MKKMAGASDGEILPDVDYRILERRKELINDILRGIFREDVNFYLETLKKLNEPAGICYTGLTGPEPYICGECYESRMEINFMLRLEKKNLVVCEKKRDGEGEVYRYTYRIAEEHRNPLNDLLKELSL